MEEAESFWELRRDHPHLPKPFRGPGKSKICHPGERSELCLMEHGEGVTLLVEGIARESHESGWGRKGRHHALCRVSELSR